MFANIGGKIKGLARAVCWIGIIFSVIMGFVNIASGSSVMAASGWVILILGPLFSWIGSFVLYGFGELIDRVVSIDEKIEGNNSKDSWIGQILSGNKIKYNAPEKKTPMENENKEKPVLKGRKSDDPDWIEDEEPDYVRCPECNKKMCIDFIRARKKCPDCGREY